ncbi:hypothetical protein ZPR_0435 [Zunongwangia profunda SM-A87]|uniref:Uncharacterized protein n=1 Tax=Zunongwangia profunda (strain DSM 18752 / CCTCC AB 206139 / SM-A87) TaxID=655815 RepID=D5BER4_ZUNPS|nr:hypothetical protein ZPR_0435 [Zunongwangia profunda SM-A87]
MGIEPTLPKKLDFEFYSYPILKPNPLIFRLFFFTFHTKIIFIGSAIGLQKIKKTFLHNFF